MGSDSIFKPTKAPVFSEDLLKKLSEDYSYISKESAAQPSFLRRAAPYLGTAVGMSALAGTLGYFAAKKRHETHTEDLKKSYDSLVGTHKEYGSDPQKFNQRFTELTLISPTVAANPRLAHKVIQPRLSKGFDLDDIHRLSSIEYHSSNTKKVQDPASVGTATAGSEFLRYLGVFAPTLAMQAAVPQIKSDISKSTTKAQTDIQKSVKDTAQAFADRIRKLEKTNPQKAQEEKEAIQRASQQATSNLAARLQSADPKKAAALAKIMQGLGVDLAKVEEAAKAAPENPFEKKSSEEPSMKVSEECLGRMLADRYSMYKTAARSNILRDVGKFLSPGAKALENHFKIMALPLAIAGGIKLLSDAMKSADNARTREEAERVFAQLKRTNEYVKDQPQLANEAFDTLKSFAPSLAAKPIVARTFIENVVKGGMIPVDQANALAKTEQLIQNLHESGKGGFLEGLKSPMSLFSHTIATHKKKSE